jgi:hypothetical protein
LKVDWRKEDSVVRWVNWRGVGKDTVLGCRKVGEGAACRDPEYDHVWGERLFNKEVRKDTIY